METSPWQSVLMPRSADEETLRQVTGRKGDSFRLGLLFSSACGLPLSFVVFLRARERYCFDIPIGDPCQYDGPLQISGLLWLGLFSIMLAYAFLTILRGERHYGVGLIYGAVFYALQIVVAIALGSMSALVFN